jgi:peptidoglycan-N-acetylglucosamine deacetylase
VIVTTSWDDGHVLDLRLADMLADAGVAATFYIALENQEIPRRDRLPSGEIRKLAERFEIGSHSQTHAVLTRVPLAVARREMVDSKLSLQDLTGQSVDTFCYPRGAHNRRLAECARASGYTYARTIGAFELGIPRDLYRAAATLETARPGVQYWPTSGFKTYAAGVGSMKNLADWQSRAIALFDHAWAASGVFHLWGHSWVLDRRGQWEKLRAVLRHISEFSDVEMLTNGQLALRAASRRGV